MEERTIDSSQDVEHRTSDTKANIATLEHTLAQQAATLARQAAALAAVEQQQMRLAGLQLMLPPEMRDGLPNQRGGHPIGPSRGSGSIAATPSNPTNAYLYTRPNSAPIAPTATSHPPPWALGPTGSGRSPRHVPAPPLPPSSETHVGPRRPVYVSSLQRYALVHTKPTSEPHMLSPTEQDLESEAIKELTEEDAKKEMDGVGPKLHDMSRGIRAANAAMFKERANALGTHDAVFKEADEYFKNDKKSKMAVRAILLKTSRAASRVYELAQSVEREVDHFNEKVPVFVLPAFDQSLKEVSKLQKQLRSHQEKVYHKEKLEMMTRSTFRLALAEAERQLETALAACHTQITEQENAFERRMANETRQKANTIATLEQEVIAMRKENMKLQVELEKEREDSAFQILKLQQDVKNLTSTVGSQKNKLSMDTQGWQRKIDEERKKAEEDRERLERQRVEERASLERASARLKRVQEEALKLNDPVKARQFLYFESMKPPEPKYGEIAPPRSSLSWRGVDDKFDANADPKARTRATLDALTAAASKSVASVSQSKKLGEWKNRGRAAGLLSKANNPRMKR